MNNFNITELPNGIKVVSEHIPYLKSFSLGFWFNAGSRDETEDTSGITHFIEHMLFKGTEKRTPKKIADDIESLGGYLNAFTSKEHTCFYGRGLAEYIGKTFEVLADMVTAPLFKTLDIKKEAAVIIDEMNEIEDTPEELIFDELEKTMFKGNPLSMPIIGQQGNIINFSRETLLKYYRENFGANNMYIVASGLVDHDKLVELTTEFLSEMPKITRNSRQAVFHEKQEGPFIYKDIQQAHVITGFPTYGVNNKERNVLNVLSQILGEGSSSRLFQTVREKNGIAYQINSFLNSFFDISSFGVYYSTNDGSVLKAQSLILKEFQKLKEKKISEKELKRAKEYLKGNLLLGLESTTNRMVRIANSVMYFGRIKPVEETINEIENVTKEMVIDAANQVIDKDKAINVLISSKNHLLQSAA